MSHDQRLEEEVQRQVAIDMSQQQQAQTVPPEPNVAADHMSQRKSSCASTDVTVEPTGIQAAVEATAPQGFPVDEITQRTSCDLQTAIKNLMITVAYGTAMPTEPGDVYTANKFRLDTQELAWSRCARVGRHLSLIFLEAMERGH